MSEDEYLAYVKSKSGELNPMYGRKNTWGKHSKETKEKISKIRIEKGVAKGVNNPRAKEIVVLTLDNKYLMEVDYIKKLEEFQITNSFSHVSGVCKGKLKTHNGYKFLYKEDYEYFISNNISFEKWRTFLKEKYCLKNVRKSTPLEN